MEKSGINTKDLDVVYFVKDGRFNEELRHSIRSVCKNMKFNRIWIFGGCPRSIIPDVRVRVEQEGRTKWDKVHSMFKMAAENKEITDNFILMNDDFYVMKPITKIEPVYRCTLEEHVKMLGEDAYANMLSMTARQLKKKGKTTYSYELHVPFIYNKKKLLKLLNEYPDMRCTRSVYGNMYKIGGTKATDVKIFSSNPDFDYKNSTFLSTDDPMVKNTCDSWRFIMKSFPGQCKYES